jgi:hypothetical protein
MADFKRAVPVLKASDKRFMALVRLRRYARQQA